MFFETGLIFNEGVGEEDLFIYNIGGFMNVKQTFCMQIENKTISKQV